MPTSPSSRPVWAEPFGRAGIEAAEVELAVNLGEAFGTAGGHFDEGGAQGGAAAQAQPLCDLDGGGTCLEDAVSVGEQIGSPEHVAIGLSERSLVAMARSHRDRAEVLAGRAGTVLRRAGIEESYATPLVSAFAVDDL